MEAERWLHEALPGWDARQSQWLTWGGRETLAPAPNEPVEVEVARCELASPRLVQVQFFVEASDPIVPATIEFVLGCGVGRIEQRALIPQGPAPAGLLIQTAVPARILRAIIRMPAQSVTGPSTVSCVMAPVFPDR